MQTQLHLSAVKDVIHVNLCEQHPHFYSALVNIRGDATLYLGGHIVLLEPLTD